MNQPPKQRSNALLVTLAVCAIAISGLMLVVVLILASHPQDDSEIQSAPTSLPPLPTRAPAPAPVPATTAPAPVPAATTDELDHVAVEAGIVKMLEDTYGISDVSNVQCPTSMVVQVNSVYTCALQVGDEDKKVTVKVARADGTYSVGRPK